jgi:hypothetical protein
LEFAQLPDGRWYPTHWQRIDQGHPLDYRLTVLPGKTLDPRWFDNPGTHFDGKVEEKPSLSTKVAAASHAISSVATTTVRTAWNWWPWTLAVAMFSGAGILLILQRRKTSTAASLQGHKGPRRK